MRPNFSVNGDGHFHIPVGFLDEDPLAVDARNLYP
jgi:hypothetical protein